MRRRVFLRLPAAYIVYNESMGASAVYIHIPFCRAKCYYCDFVSYPGLETRHREYVEALLIEISRATPEGEITSLYIGGGTPTVLAAAQLAEILGAVRARFQVADEAEITLEANPGTVEAAKLRALRRAGFNRLSLGVQAMEDETLQLLGRIHSAQEAIDAYRGAREAGFDNISIDLMYALPGQSMAQWQETLAWAVALQPEHASLYELTIEEGTRFAELFAAGRLPAPEDDLRLEMYEAAISELTSAGFEHYEVSNFARPRRRSRHNQVYWRNESHFGFGAGAVRYLNGERCALTKSVEEYIAAIRAGGEAAESCEQLTGRRLMGETVMLALRTSEGVELAEFARRFGVELTEVYGESVAALQREGLVEVAGGRLRLTHRGLLLANQASLEFVEAD